MPAVENESSRFSHLCVGGHDTEYIRSGVKLEAHEANGKIMVTVTNHATGHNFPGERHNRVLLLQITQRNKADEITLNLEETIKDITPFRGESSAEQIQIDQAFETSTEIVGNAAHAEIRLLYKPFPWYRIDQAMVLHEKQLELTP